MTDIYTDGSWSIQSHRGGYAVVVVRDGKATEFHHAPLTKGTSNRAELFALIKALEISQQETEVTIYSDSRYIVSGYTTWMGKWNKEGWKNSKERPLKNSDLWRKVFSLRQPYIKIKWIRGHSGNEHNELADALAKY